MKKNLYLAGKVKDTTTHNRLGGWRNKLILDLFNVNIEMGLNASEDNPDITRVIPINDEFVYVGPFLYGCDHSCAHREPYAHGILTCTSDDGKYMLNHPSQPNYFVLELSLKEIAMADIIIANFNEMPMEAYGMIAEIGYARAKHKKIFGLGSHIPELWFVQGMCEMYCDVNELKTAIEKYSKEHPTPKHVTLGQIIWDNNEIMEKQTKRYVGVISKNIRDFLDWKIEKGFDKINPYNMSRKFEVDNTFYICLSQPDHVRGYRLDEVISTSNAKMNKRYYDIIDSCEPALKK